MASIFKGFFSAALLASFEGINGPDMSRFSMVGIKSGNQTTLPPSMQLCLVNNDPGSTPLITPEGEPLYSIETPTLPYTELIGPSSCPPQSKCVTTTVKRIERYQASTGHVETSIGVIEFCGPTSGAHLLLCSENHRLHIEPGQRLITDAPERAQGDDNDESSWEFTGPDSRRYKWQMLVQCPWLFLADNSFTPLARYRRAKIGIVSRSRRAFLEILPAGIGIIDLIVVTFVAFIKQRMYIEGTASYDACPVSNSASLASTFVAASEPPNRKPGVSIEP